MARTDARCLVLGSMPGALSLERAEYYAHPRNAFWPITGRLFGFDPQAPYAERIAALTGAGVALWDVIGRCTRRSSLDTDIVETSIAVNDFVPFLRRHPDIEVVFFNGLKAAQCWRRYVQPLLAGHPELPGRRLPSTSPAHAGMSFEQKLAVWREVAETARRTPGSGS